MHSILKEKDGDCESGLSRVLRLIWSMNAGDCWQTMCFGPSLEESKVTRTNRDTLSLVLSRHRPNVNWSGQEMVENQTITSEKSSKLDF